LIITVTAALLIYLLFLGFVQQLHVSGVDGAHLIWQSAYKALQTIAFETTAEELAESGYLVTGGILAILLAAFTVTSVVIIFWERIQLALLISPFGENSHVLVVGLGKAGLHLVRNLRERNQRVVVVELDSEETSCAVAIARDLGAIVVRGDISDPEVMLWAQCSKAYESYILTGNDAVNLETAYKLVRDSFGRQASYFRQRSTTLCQQIQDSSAARGLEGRRVLRPINIHEITARELLFNGICSISVNKTAVLHVVIVGFCQLGKEIAHQLALHCHFRNLKRLRVTIIYDVRADGRDAFLGSYPAFGYEVSKESDCLDGQFDAWDFRFSNSVYKGVEHVVSVNFCPAHGGLPDSAVRRCLQQLPMGEDFIYHIAVCVSDDETHNFEAARFIQEMDRKDFRLHVHIPNSDSIPEILNVGGGRSAVNCFGQLAKILNPEDLRSDGIDRLSEATHEYYRKSFFRDLKSENSSDADPKSASWADLQESYRRACRNRVIGLLVKIRQLTACEREKLLNSDPAVIRIALGTGFVEELAEMEHNRWMAERLMDGWRWGVERDNMKKFHPDILPYQQLRESVKELDRNVVEQIAMLLRDENV